MGTHPTSPSSVASTNQKLSEYLAANPQLLGTSVIERFDASDGNLPFLFKVLSIEKALSIQTHPDKATAQKLHADQPKIYKGLDMFSADLISTLTGKSRPESQTRDGFGIDAVYWFVWFYPT